MTNKRLLIIAIILTVTLLGILAYNYYLTNEISKLRIPADTSQNK